MSRKGCKQRFKEIYLKPWCSFDEAVNELLAARKRGEHVYIIFNGKKIKSDNIKTINDAYIYMYGCNKEEMKQINESNCRFTTELDYKLNQFYQRYNRNLLYQERNNIDRDVWIKLESSLSDSFENVYTGAIYSNILCLVISLSKFKNFEKAFQIFKKQGHSSLSASYVLRKIIDILPNCADFSNYVIEREKEDKLSNNYSKKLFKKSE